MATVDQCRAALHGLASRLAGVEHEVRAKHTADRTLSLKIWDLGVVFSGRLHDGELVDVEQDGEQPKAQLRLSCTSDDLLALTAGELSPAGAWASGKLRIEASPLDLLRLRTLL